MGFFDDDDEEEVAGTTVSADPGALSSAFDAVVEAAEQRVAAAPTPEQWAQQQVADIQTEGNEQLLAAQDGAQDFATRAERDVEADPLSFVTGSTSEIDMDPDDGTMTLKYQSGLVDVDGHWEDGKGMKYTGKVGSDQGPMPESVQVDAESDADGNLTRMDGQAKLTVPVEGNPISLEANDGFVRTDQGWKIEGKHTIGGEVEGENVKAGLQGGYEDLGNGDYAVHGGPTAGISKGAGDLHTGDNVVNAEGNVTLDAGFSQVGGQTKGGARIISDGEVDAYGNPVLQGQVDTGAFVTTGPDGTRVTVDSGAKGTLTTPDGDTVSLESRETRDTGFDAEGNRVDTTTTTRDGKIETSDGTVVESHDTDTTDGDAFDVFDAVQDAPPVDARGTFTPDAFDDGGDSTPAIDDGPDGGFVPDLAPPVDAVQLDPGVLETALAPEPEPELEPDPAPVVFQEPAPTYEPPTEEAPSYVTDIADEAADLADDLDWDE